MRHRQQPTLILYVLLQTEHLLLLHLILTHVLRRGSLTTRRVLCMVPVPVTGTSPLLQMVILLLLVLLSTHPVVALLALN